MTDRQIRAVLAGLVSNTLKADIRVEALNEATYRLGPPEIMDSDQRSQLSSFARTKRLRRSGIRISMNGKSRYPDNICIEHLCWTLK